MLLRVTVPTIALIFPAILSKTSWRKVMISTNWSDLTEPSRLGRSDRLIVVPTEASASVSDFWTAAMSVIDRGTSPMVMTGRVVTIGWPAAVEHVAALRGDALDGQLVAGLEIGVEGLQVEDHLPLVLAAMQVHRGVIGPCHVVGDRPGDRDDGACVVVLAHRLALQRQLRMARLEVSLDAGEHPLPVGAGQGPPVGGQERLVVEVVVAPGRDERRERFVGALLGAGGQTGHDEETRGQRDRTASGMDHARDCATRIPQRTSGKCREIG